MNPSLFEKKSCVGGCKAQPGELHERGCDVERCLLCGGQRISCGCRSRTREPWSGIWPGFEECRSLGWFSRWRVAGDPRSGYVRCDANDPDAWPDLNRLVTECAWDPEARRWRKPS